MGQETFFPPAQIHEDARYLHAALKTHHPNLYLYTTKAEMDAFFVGLQNIQEPMTGRDFYNSITPVLEKIKDGHTLIFPDAKSSNNPGLLYFPFKIFIEGDRVFLEANYSNNLALENGVEILRINQMSSSDIVRFLFQRLMRDGHNIQYPNWILNNYFSTYYSYFFGHPASFELETVRNDGNKQNAVVKALPRSEIKNNRMLRYGNAAKARGLNNTAGEGITLKCDSAERVAILTIREFDNDILSSVYQQPFRKTIKTCFREIEIKNPSCLVIDLRGNQGGDLENGIFLLSALMPSEFSVVDRYFVVKEQEGEKDKERIKGKKGVGTGYQIPTDRAYKGNVYLLVDGGSFSNSAIVAAAFQRHKRGKIIGQETGGNRTVLCGYEKNIVLPNTSLIVSIPTRRFLLPSNETNDGHGVIPDFIIEPTIGGIIAGKDETLEFALQLIRKEGK